jgi:hypothetical protein
MISFAYTHRALACLLAALTVASGAGAATCPGGKTGTVGTGDNAHAVTRLDKQVFFSVKSLALDFDGSPEAYGVRDQGQENICVGLAPASGPCRGKFRGACYKVCRDTFAAWSRQSGDPKRLGDTMCSVGLGGSSCSKPEARLQSSPREAWFVSETSLKTSPKSGPANAAWLQGQAAQLDPKTVRYLVVPSSLRTAPWNVQFGDVGVAVNAAGGEPIPFIVGDGGGLGEGSLALLSALKTAAPPSLTKDVSALGEPVMRFKSGVSGDFRFVIFKDTATLAQGSQRLTIHTAETLPTWVDETAAQALKVRSSKAQILACSRAK